LKIFVLNSGSSSLKFQLFENEKVICKGMVDRIGESSILILNGIKENKKLKDHSEALKEIIFLLIKEKIINSRNDIDAIGHRVVHGGEYFKDSVLINSDVIKKIKKCISLAPLHNPANLSGILACKKLFSGKKQVAVFDTAFHQSMPKEAYYYGINKKFYDKYSIRRYGFHGTSYKYISEQIKKTNKKLKNIIVCHLGNGASICAIKNNKSIDTSMGFTPLEGLIMGTRSGDIDPAIISFISEKEKLGVNQVINLLNKDSGLKTFSNISSDMRDIWKKENEGVIHAKTSIDLFSYRIKKYIGSYITALGGIDAIVFTGGIGENAFYVRSRSLSNLKFLGIELDEKKNKKNEHLISKKNSKVKIYVMQTNEELMICKDTIKLIS